MFTPVEARMLAVLADGEAHRDVELHACLNDTMSPVRNIRAHISVLRRKLKQSHQTVVCERRHGSTLYRHVVHLSFLKKLQDVLA